MRKSICAVIACVIGGSWSLATLDHEAQAAEHEQKSVLACYQWVAFPNERLKLNIEHHSRLTEPAEERKFDHSRQTAFSVHGKYIGDCGGGTMAAVTGTVVTASQHGAHMGVVAHYSRGFGVTDFCRSITFDCTTSEDSAAPDLWQCQSRNEFDVYHGISELKKVDATEDERCSFFQNGSFATARAQLPSDDLGRQSSGGSPAGVLPSRGRTVADTQPGGGSALSQRRIDQGALNTAVLCYYDRRANGVDDLTARFFCGLRPYPPWTFEVDPRVLR